MRLRHCFLASMAALFALASPLCALACSVDVSPAPAAHEVLGDSQEHPCHDSGPPAESDAPSETCEDRCMSLELAATGERGFERSNPLLVLLAQPPIAWSLTPYPVRSSKDRAHPEPPKRPSILLLKSTLLI